MRNVTLSDFQKGVAHRDVETIVFRGESNGSSFDLGFLPEGEFLYHFNIAPDVYFQNLPIREVYYEPCRTFLYLHSPISIQMHSPKREAAYDKLVVKAK